ncbi:GNAT family N-acetyltransferase [Mycobacterium basiliense]|uniref:GNAT family N-acetyltransferase n=1 Tax=Mycobacterium basiliense TaxID=2094119 RepID=UPI001E3CA0E5|nr:GNAT family N-acetyltransferase [Mycobacterium basiliense]
MAAADPLDAAELAAVAARTFPLACPASVAAEHVASFIEAHLSVTRFDEYLSNPRYVVLAARADGRIIGYAMLVRDAAESGSAELSKLYLLPDFHGKGTSSALMDAALAAAATWGAGSMWLGVNQENERAQRFYLRCGFKIRGTRTFQLGDHVENDYVLSRPISC